MREDYLSDGGGAGVFLHQLPRAVHGEMLVGVIISHPFWTAMGTWDPSAIPEKPLTQREGDETS